MSKYKEYLKQEPIAGYSLFCDAGFLIYDVDNIEDKVIIADTLSGKIAGFRKNKIHYNAKGEPYFNHFGRKIYFNECLRVM